MSAFPETRWSMVSAVRGTDELTASNALEDLCRLYRPAVLAFAEQALRDPHEAEDLTQVFFADVLAKRRMEQADKSAGKFRTFLLTHFQFVLKDHLKRRRAEKRGGRLEHVSAEELTDADAPVSLPDTSSFDVSWAMAVVREAVRLLEIEESIKAGGIPFQELKGFLPGFQAGQSSSYEDLAKLHAVSEGALRVRINRLRGRFKELLNSVLADTVSSAADLESERQALLAGLLRSLG
jgi:RNA polymerase sigma factor (sigma-70 family)